jgi:hypothetical protein
MGLLTKKFAVPYKNTEISPKQLTLVNHYFVAYSRVLVLLQDWVPVLWDLLKASFQVDKKALSPWRKHSVVPPRLLRGGVRAADQTR